MNLEEVTTRVRVDDGEQSMCNHQCAAGRSQAELVECTLD